MEQLDDIRRQITEIDNQMAELFKARMEQVVKVAQYKKAHDLPVFDPEREQQVLLNGGKRIQNPELEPYYIEFLQNVMEVSKNYQRDILKNS